MCSATGESESRSVVPSCLRPHGLYSPWNSPGQNTRVGSLSFLQGIFPTQGTNPGLPHCRQVLYQLSHKGSPRILEWVTYAFSRRSSQLQEIFPTQESNQGLLHCRWILYQLSYEGSPATREATAMRSLCTTTKSSPPSLKLEKACTQQQSRVQLSATPWTVGHQAPLSIGILQARILEWVAMPSSRGSS